MRRYMISSLLVLSAISILSSCSIKEDRSPCPCWLDIFFSSFPKEGVVLAGYTSDRVFHEIVAEGDFVDFVEYTVPRVMLGVSAYRTNPSITPNGKMVLIQKGNQADSLYAHLSYVDCRGEFAIDTVCLHKQFATVYLSFENSEGESVDTYDVIVKGKVNGMDLTTLRPIEGEYEFCPQIEGNNLYIFRLPRQKDDTLAIELYRKDNGEYVDTIDAGSLIARSGFDWNASDLQDIVICVDFAKVEIEVNVHEWDSEEIYDVTI